MPFRCKGRPQCSSSCSIAAIKVKWILSTINAYERQALECWPGTRLEPSGPVCKSLVRALQVGYS